MLNARGAGSQGSLHDRNLTGRLHLQRCLCALFKSSLTNRTLKRSIYFLGIVREIAAEKTAGQDLALLYPSILCSPAPPPLSLAGYKNRNNNENLKKKKKIKKEREVQHRPTAGHSSGQWKHMQLHRVGFIFPNTSPPGV